MAYKGKILGRKVTFKDEEHIELVRRFDRNNTEPLGELHYQIDIPCILCTNYKLCEGCPLQKIATSKNVGCYEIVNSLFPDDIGKLEMGQKCLMWKRKDHKRVIKMLDIIQDKLFEMEIF